MLFFMPVQLVKVVYNLDTRQYSPYIYIYIPHPRILGCKNPSYIIISNSREIPLNDLVSSCFISQSTQLFWVCLGSMGQGSNLSVTLEDPGGSGLRKCGYGENTPGQSLERTSTESMGPGMALDVGNHIGV